MTSNTILKSGLLGYSFGQIRMGVSSQKNTSSVIHFEKKIFVIFEKKQVIVSCKCRPAGSRLLLRLFIIYSAMYDVDILERLRQETKTGFSWAEVFGVSKNAKIQSNTNDERTYTK